MDAVDRNKAIRGPCQSPISDAISRPLIHISHSLTAVVTPSLAGVRKTRGRPAFMIALSIKIHFSRETLLQLSKYLDNIWMKWTWINKAYSRALVAS
jgi:hypothetical protein